MGLTDSLATITFSIVATGLATGCRRDYTRRIYQPNLITTVAEMELN